MPKVVAPKKGPHHSAETLCRVIVMDDDGDEIQVDIPAPEAPPLSIKIEHEDIPQDPEESDEPALRRSTRNRVQRQMFSPM